MLRRHGVRLPPDISLFAFACFCFVLGLHLAVYCGISLFCAQKSLLVGFGGPYGTLRNKTRLDECKENLLCSSSLPDISCPKVSDSKKDPAVSGILGSPSNAGGILCCTQKCSGSHVVAEIKPQIDAPVAVYPLSNPGFTFSKYTIDQILTLPHNRLITSILYFFSSPEEAPYSLPIASCASIHHYYFLCMTYFSSLCFCDSSWLIHVTMSIIINFLLWHCIFYHVDIHIYLFI